MKITLIVASSINGYITINDKSNPSLWTSEEDKKLLRETIESHRVLLMGSGTYKAYKSKLRLEPERLRLVMTHRPEAYVNDAVSNMLEFTRENPKALIERLSKAGYKKLLLVSGEGINKLFFEASLIDEIHLTIEPYLFGSGKKITAAFSGFRNLKLLSCEQLNKNGTLLVRYKVIDKLNKSKLNRST